jgi:hypothetical protein
MARMAGTSARRRWTARIVVAVLLAAALQVWSPAVAGLLVREAHRAFHEGDVARAHGLLRVAGWLQPPEAAGKAGPTPVGEPTERHCGSP